MPILPTPAYQPPFPFTNGHVQTLYPTLWRRVGGIVPQRERITTADGDFVDIDWHYSISGTTKKLAIVSHGLEGNSRKSYPLGMARHLCHLGWDVICLNFRGCSGEPNRLPRMYHSGLTNDLHAVIVHGLATRRYETAALIGFSMGGNQTLKYLGENPGKVPDEVQAAVVFSVPCDLAESVAVMDRWCNSIYMRYFMGSLKAKIREKARLFPGVFDLTDLEKIRTFVPFDDRYTAPLHGFRDAADYYHRCSASQFLPTIRLPSLIVQAADDPFLSSSSYPLAEARHNPCLHLEMPRYGGHVGFVAPNRHGAYWSEIRAGSFLMNICRLKRCNSSAGCKKLE